MKHDGSITNSVVAVVLARGGSKGIHRKNLQPLAGVPLLGRALHLLGEVPEVKRRIVSTDDSEIASLAMAYGAEIPFLRPAALATDEAPSLPALEHAIRYLVNDGETAPYVLLYQATSPFCRPEQISGAIEKLIASGKDCLKSVTAVKEHPHWMGQIEDGELRYLYDAEERASRRQDLPPLFRLNGAISVYRTEALLEGTAQDSAPLAYVMDAATSLDLDTIEDWQFAEARLEQLAEQA